MGRRKVTIWGQYGACPKCAVEAAERCRDMRGMTWKLRAYPHEERPMVQQL